MGIDLGCCCLLCTWHRCSGPDAGYGPGTVLGPRATAACKTGPIFKGEGVCTRPQAAGDEDIREMHVSDGISAVETRQGMERGHLIF